jgi:hypothetical protein
MAVLPDGDDVAIFLCDLGIVGVAVLLVVIGRGTAIGGWLYLLLGIILGVVIRNLRLYHQTVRLWPVLDSIIDWDKVEALRQTQLPTGAEIHDLT